MPQTAESRQMPISYPSTTERFGESIGVELRIRPRARDRTHIDEQFDAYPLEQRQEFADRTR
jgi:membrane-anchored protein YejM (alkaline phosphatase superfamily)